jgi:Domain of unknown function (DUF3943)
MQQGWVWDLDDFTVNQIGHPYQGTNYFTAGRANGLSFYESAAVTAFGSATWEFFGETNHASLNDFINTTLGGVTLGEMFHRAGWLIRNTNATGKRRLWSEIGATALDPITGLNRFVSGDSSRVTDKPSDLVPSSLSGVASAGVLWRGSQSSAFTEAGDPFVEVDAYYGDANVGRSRTPYDAFWLRMRFGGGSAFSEARVRGRLFGQPLGKSGLQFSVIQTYNYQNNDAYSTGSQAIDAAIGTSRALSPRTNFWILGWGGLTVLGAVDSLPLGVTERPEEETSSAGQGVSEGPRYYDYGPGSDFGTLARLTRDGREVLLFFYVGRQIYSLDGVRANHFLQHTRVDRRRRRGSGSWRAGRPVPSAATARIARRTFPSGMAAPSSAMPAIESIREWTSGPTCSGCSGETRAAGSGRRPLTPSRSFGRGSRRVSS